MNRILIVGHSGRMLAQALKTIGLSVIVIDLFADIDTQGLTDKIWRVESLAKASLEAVVEKIRQDTQIDGFIYGSGFESFPESLAFLATQFRCLGNTAAVFLRLQNKPYFFDVLDDLGIPTPPVQFEAPSITEAGWLIKPMQGQGGIGIQVYKPQKYLDDVQVIKGEYYWQKYQTGTPQSVLFLADQNAVQIVGFNTQWNCVLGGEQAFIFSGIINDSVLTPDLQAIIATWVGKIAKAFGLIGLNSMDFICTDNECRVLEVNARLSASVQLYSAEWLRRHIAVCAGHKLAGQAVPIENNGRSNAQIEAEFSGYQIVYAEQVLIVPEPFCWPEWCVDLPRTGAIIGTNQPICSIIASNQSAGQVRGLLQARQLDILKQLSQVF